MANLRRRRSLGKNLARLSMIGAVFAAGLSSHWLYMNGSATHNFLVAGLKAKFSSQNDAGENPRYAPDASQRTAANVKLLAEIWHGKKPTGPSWKAENPAEMAVLRNHLEQMARRKQQLLIVGEIGRNAAVSVAAAPYFPPRITQPGRFLTALLGPVDLAAPPSFPQELVSAGAENRIIHEITLRANVLPPVDLNQLALAFSAMRLQALEAKLAYRSMESRFRKTLGKERQKLLSLAAERINLASAVQAPQRRLAVNRYFASALVVDPEKHLKQLAGAVLPPAAVRITVPSLQEARRIALNTQRLGKKQNFSVRPGSATPVSTGFSHTGGALAAINRLSQPSRSSNKSIPASPAALSGIKLAAYAPLPTRAPATQVILPVDPPVAANIDLVKEAIGAYLKGDMEEGDSLGKKAEDPLTKLAIEWARLRLQPRKSGFFRISKFLADHPDWPARKWLHWRAEQALFVDRPARKHVERYLKEYEPRSVVGHVLQARQFMSKGDKKNAAAVLRKVWWNKRFSNWLEAKILKEFGGLLTSDDHGRRSAHQFYKGRFKASLRSAGRGGKDLYALAAARIVVSRGKAPEKAGKKLSAKMRKDATWRYAQIRRLRRAKKIEAAAKLVLSAKAQQISGPGAKVWWEEHRSIARRLLDAGKPNQAYKVAAHHPAVDGADYLDGEFYSGFIALRFLNKPKIAMTHFARALSKARTPISKSRAAYWQARAAEKIGEQEEAERLYALAAVHSSSYYGQLAGARRGRRTVPIRRSNTIASGEQRLLSTRLIDIFKQAEAEKLALHLVVASARTLTDRSQIAALAAVLRRHKDARASLLLGKLAAHRGIELDDIAYPDFGVPQFTRLANSAEKPLVYAITRQESAFQSDVTSHAGAKGLMQMLTSTARRTAKRQGVEFDPARLLSDPAFNAQLGAAHLGELMRDHPGSLLLVFAAYNAGGGRVNQWIKAYGDPRKPGIDPIDWVERIPFSETRNYVQRVAENLGVYRSLFGRDDLPYLAIKDLRAYAARQ